MYQLGSDGGANIAIPSAAGVLNVVGLVLSLTVLGVGLVTVVKAAHKGK